MRKGTTLTFMLSDHPSITSGHRLGSTSLITNATGGVISETRYTAWGEVRYQGGSEMTKYQFTGQYSDSYINLLDYGSRRYDPELGRFIQPDSIVPLASQGVQAYDRYGYVNNNPVRYTDPTGHFIPLITAAIGAIAFTALVAITHPGLSFNDYAAAAVVGTTAGLLIGTGVGAGAGLAMAAVYVGAGAGIATAATAYTVTAGDSYNTREMGANALVGGVTGALTAATGPAVLEASVAKAGITIATRSLINAAGTQATQIIHNEYYDDQYPSYPSDGELIAGGTFGGIASGFGEFFDTVVTVATGSDVAGNITYQAVKNFGSSYAINRVTNWVDCVGESPRTGSTCRQ